MAFTAGCAQNAGNAAICGLGVGGRYWHLQSKGDSHFQAVGGTAQPLDFKSKIYGVFVQGSYRFGAF